MRFRDYIKESKSKIKQHKINIDASYYEDLKRHAPEFNKLLKLPKRELIKQLAKKLWFQRNKEGRIIAIEKEIANRKYSNLEMAYLIYTVEYNQTKIEDHNISISSSVK